MPEDKGKPTPPEPPQRPPDSELFPCGEDIKAPAGIEIIIPKEDLPDLPKED